MKLPITVDAGSGKVVDPKSILNPDYENATHRIWFIGLEPCPVELGGDGVIGPYEPINIGPAPVELLQDEVYPSAMIPVFYRKAKE